ncbi:hypothetical protein [Pontivivens nitratireducens]|uniref:hypothetical protein n=1 Tax=Pontivivens nitratireducens TaxID=2758038 RepID=UPI00163A26BB|nr:hypothetical protein [Pontibrevibacter nitratireducens]
MATRATILMVICVLLGTGPSFAQDIDPIKIDVVIPAGLDHLAGDTHDVFEVINTIVSETFCDGTCVTLIPIVHLDSTLQLGRALQTAEHFTKPRHDLLTLEIVEKIAGCPKLGDETMRMSIRTFDGCAVQNSGSYLIGQRLDCASLVHPKNDICRIFAARLILHELLHSHGVDHVTQFDQSSRLMYGLVPVPSRRLKYEPFLVTHHMVGDIRTY